MLPLQQTGYGSVSNLVLAAPAPSGNADTIARALGPFFNKPEEDLIRGAAETGFFTYNQPSCMGGGVGGGVGGQLASVGITAGLSGIPIAGPLLAKVFGAINPIAHHAAAVRTEQATLCQAVPDANNFLRQIDSAVAQGQLDVGTAALALEQGYTNWLAEVKPIMKTGAGKNCNAACVYAKAFRAAIEKRKADYALVVAQNSAGGQGVTGGVVSAIQNGVDTIVHAFAPSAPSNAPLVPPAPYSPPSARFASPAPPANPQAAAGGGSSFALSVLPSSATSVLTKAGFTPSSQSVLAALLLAGGGLLSLVLFRNLIFGGSK